MHDTARSGPCGLPDGHRSFHRTLEGARRNRALDPAYNATSAGRDRVEKWRNANPGHFYLSCLNSNRRRAA